MGRAARWVKTAVTTEGLPGRFGFLASTPTSGDPGKFASKSIRGTLNACGSNTTIALGFAILATFFVMTASKTGIAGSTSLFLRNKPVEATGKIKVPEEQTEALKQLLARATNESVKDLRRRCKSIPRATNRTAMKVMMCTVLFLKGITGQHPITGSTPGAGLKCQMAHSRMLFVLETSYSQYKVAERLRCFKYSGFILDGKR